MATSQIHHTDQFTIPALFSSSASELYNNRRQSENDFGAMKYEELIATAIPRYIASNNPDDLCEAIIWQDSRVWFRIYMSGKLEVEATLTPGEYKDVKKSFPQLFAS